MMSRVKTVPEKNSDRALIGEMMLAKTMLEEKNELIDRKDIAIRELETRLKQRDAELAEAGEELQRSMQETEASCERAQRRGRMEIIGEVVRLAADYDQSGTSNLASRLIRLFRDRYGLEVIDGAAEHIDPDVHRVIEVVRREERGETGFEVLARGFKMNGKVIRPALVKVIEEAPPKRA
jgi:molecular chaperone GrpE